jgi:hypothetical protein
MYLVQYFGDIEHGDQRSVDGRWITVSWAAENRGYNYLSEALHAITTDFPLEWDREEKRDIRRTPDPEDDRIVVWELQAGETLKAVWHFSGWHWDSEEFGLSQGTLPGDKSSLYDLAMEDM